MGQSAEYTSREGVLTCTPREIFEFAADMGNMINLLPPDTAKIIESTGESCALSFDPLGSMKIQIIRKIPYSEVVYRAELLDIQNLLLNLEITGGDSEKAKVVIRVNAEMNPFMKMMAEKHIARFLDILIREMEKFRDWKKS